LYPFGLQLGDLLSQDVQTETIRGAFHDSSVTPPFLGNVVQGVRNDADIEDPFPGYAFQDVVDEVAIRIDVPACEQRLPDAFAGFAVVRVIRLFGPVQHVFTPTRGGLPAKPAER